MRESTEKARDSVVEDATDKDIVVIVMGQTGAGKSTFINTLLGGDIAAVGDGIQSQTTSIQHYPFFHHPELPGRRILLVDTPGFDDTTTKEETIYERIENWMTASYPGRKQKANLIYLHDISSRITPRSKRMSYEVFMKICDEDGVVLATTMWSDVTQQTGEEREKELGNGFWRDLCSRGSTVHRVELSTKSALEIVNSLLLRVAAIQREMIDERKKRVRAETDLGHLPLQESEVYGEKQGRRRHNTWFAHYFQCFFGAV